MTLNNIIFRTGIVLMTFPVVLGAGMLSEKERTLLAVLSAFLAIFWVLKLKKIFYFFLFLSVFTASFLVSQFIFLGRIDLLLLEAAVGILILFLKKDSPLGRPVDSPPGSLLRHPVDSPSGHPMDSTSGQPAARIGDFSVGLILLVIVTFALQFFTNRVILDCYLDFWIDLKRHFPVFLFCLLFFILRGVTSDIRLKNWTCYFVGLFTITLLLPLAMPASGKRMLTRKHGHNLAFFYRGREDWQGMNPAMRRGLAYQYLDLWQKAGDEFKKIVIAFPYNVDAHFNLARSYTEDSLWYEAIWEYNRVIELEPSYPGSHYGLATAYEKAGKRDKAIKEFLKEIEINPDGIKSYLALEKIYEEQGLIRDASRVRAQRLRRITSSIENISDDNLRILPVVLDSGSVTVEVVARGTFANSFWPRMEVWLSREGRLIRGGEAWVKSGEWQSYYFNFKTSPGEERLIVHFVNDFFGGPDNDRNLYIKKINFIYSR